MAKKTDGNFGGKLCSWPSGVHNPENGRCTRCGHPDGSSDTFAGVQRARRAESLRAASVGAFTLVFSHPVQ